jgi:hypothetical protein
VFTPEITHSSSSDELSTSHEVRNARDIWEAQEPVERNISFNLFTSSQPQFEFTSGPVNLDVTLLELE